MTGDSLSPELGILDTSVVTAEGFEPIPGLLAISAVKLAGLPFAPLVNSRQGTEMPRAMNGLGATVLSHVGRGI